MTSRRLNARSLIAAAIAAPWAVWAVVRGLGLDRFHPVIALISFTPYMAMTALVPVAAALMLRRWAVAGVAAVAALALALAVLPRGVASDDKATAGDRGPTLVVMTSNVQYGQGDARWLMRHVRQYGVDVLALQEVTPDAMPRLDRAGAKDVFPERIVDARVGAGGSALLARRPLRPSGPRDMTGSAQPEGAMNVPGAGPLLIKVVHPPTPTTRAGVQRWKSEIRGLPGPREGSTPRIVVGDFNATLDHREMRKLIDRGWFDAADAAGEGLKSTWPVTPGRWRPRLAIDRVLAPPPIKVRRVSMRYVPPSDHRALIVELVLPPRPRE